MKTDKQVKNKINEIMKQQIVAKKFLINDVTNDPTELLDCTAAIGGGAIAIAILNWFLLDE